MTCCSHPALPIHHPIQPLGGQGFSHWVLGPAPDYQGPLARSLLRQTDRQTEGLQAKSDDLYFLKSLPGLPSEHSQGHYSSWWAASVLLPQLRA